MSRLEGFLRVATSPVISLLTVLPLLALALSGCENENDAALRKKWEGAMIVKICPDGTRIWRLASGEFYTGGFSARVENAGTVCDISRRNGS